MRKGGGGPKGGAFERLVCKALSMAVSGGKRKDLYWRSSQSGGRATVMNRNPHGQRNLSQIGDVSSIAVEGSWLTDQYLCECKHHRTVEFTHFLLNGKGRISKWIATARSQADGKKFLLIFKQNNMPILVLTDAPCISDGATASLDFKSILTVGDGGLKLLTFTELLRVLGKLGSPPTERRRPK